MKKKIKLLLTLIVGFAVVMLIMGIFIYFGYTKVYETDVELFTVKILGLPIYQLTKIGGDLRQQDNLCSPDSV